MMRSRSLMAVVVAALACASVAAYAAPAGAPEADAAFVAAAKAGDSRTVRALVRQRIDVNALEADGTSPLHWAVWSDDVETVTVLLTVGCSMADRTGREALPRRLAERERAGFLAGDESAVRSVVRRTARHRRHRGVGPRVRGGR